MLLPYEAQGPSRHKAGKLLFFKNHLEQRRVVKVLLELLSVQRRGHHHHPQIRTVLEYLLLSTKKRYIEGGKERGGKGRAHMVTYR